MNKILTIITLLLLGSMGCGYTLHAQENATEVTTETSKINYVYSMEEAQKLAYQKKKLIFVNCYAKWALPCVGMNQYVFGNQEFADYMNKTFINLFVDMKSADGKKLAKEYNVHSYAHYLILNYKGEIIQRISGGSKLPEFKDKVRIALSPKTSLKGTREKYESDKYSKKIFIITCTLLMWQEKILYSKNLEKNIWPCFLTKSIVKRKTGFSLVYTATERVCTTSILYRTRICS